MVRSKTNRKKIKNLKPGSTYFFYVRAIRKKERGPWSKGLKVVTRSSDTEKDTGLSPPDNLALPFRVEEINGEGFISPFGLYRKSLDRPEYGHSGIDIPLPSEIPLYAVAGGRIIGYDLATDGRGGSNLKLLISEGGNKGEGWVFLYEHVELQPNLAIGNDVEKGQLIAMNAIPERGNNHLQLTYSFNSYTYYRNHICWVGKLRTADQKALENRFRKIAKTDAFISSWQNAVEEGMYAYRELLNTEKFSNGPELCYPPGTDVREIKIEGKIIR